jgi:uncharacterized protein (TIGR00730 family)
MKDYPPKAYNNLKFLNSASARTIRILSEYEEPKNRLDYYRVKDTIVFFGSARFKDADAAQKMLTEAKNEEEKRRAKQAVRGSRYYEDARKLAAMLTKWSGSLPGVGHSRFVVCSGGGPGIMEAANRGAQEAGGRSMGLNITLPMEQEPNPYITPELSFQFHYFFMRKLWFAYLAKAMLVFPGGFGTMDEMWELLTLEQTRKLNKKMLIVVYAPDYWKSVLNVDAMEEVGAIDADDRKLLKYADTPEQAFDMVTSWLIEHYM